MKCLLQHKNWFKIIITFIDHTKAATQQLLDKFLTELKT